ncbi:group XIIA secretory phospholipase A2 [Cimex lectularius]|uniref:Group XIIA secretory phospholipase A2 n=1 Tax=Cimex lectularius TaxID=79782 RepID=A0A8I6RCV3_CIMLE|nr:group XIIA secretory phospholipase A2 [Cimex lectularius]
MEIPKAKVFIYALTFVGYIWSGYGNNVLSSLREAVLAAENVFGNFLLKFDEVVSKLKNVHDTIDSSLDEDCLWNCPNGVTAVSNKYSKPVTNGCGPEGLNVNVDAPFYNDMVKCCNTHDVCYGTCNTLKEKCDLTFKRCLYSTCENKNLDSLVLKACKGAAKVLFTATQSIGCKFFKDAQSAACYCPTPKKKKYAAGEL